jgi:hypothetical protein
MIRNYQDFLTTLLAAGFAMAGGRSEGIYAVVPFSWTDRPQDETSIRWHTGDPDTDPWVWRMRVLAERTDIAYGKFFFRKGGYITRDWYPFFLAARRDGRDFESAYRMGTISREARQIYQAIRERGRLPMHELRRQTGLKGALAERALVDLQMGLFVTVCGEAQKVSPQGAPCGWASTVLCTGDQFWGEAVLAEAARLTRQEAVDQITSRILLLNPQANARQIERFILNG